MAGIELFDRVNYGRSVSELVEKYLLAFPDEIQRLQELQELLVGAGPNICSPGNFPGHLTGSALIVNPALRSALLIQHKFLKRWLQPGGHLDHLEHPQEGALREVREEVGDLPVTIHPWHETSGIPLDIDSHRIPEHTVKMVPAHTHHDFLYVLNLHKYADIVLQEDEVDGSAWIALSELKSGRSGDRLARAVEKLERIDSL